MTAPTAISKIDPLVSTPELCLYTLPNTEMPHANRFFVLRAAQHRSHETKPTAPACPETTVVPYNTHNL